MSHLNTRRFQFVWWGWRVWGLHLWHNSYRGIYDWRAMIGPLEIRKWAKRSVATP